MKPSAASAEARRWSMAFDTPIQLDQVTAELNYLAPMSEKPVSYNYEPPAGTPWRTGRYVPERVAVRNARLINSALSLDRQGFVLRWHSSAVTNFYDVDEVKSVYHAEIERLVMHETGASRVVVFDTTTRSALALPGKGPVKEPARRIHNDYTEASGPQRVRDLVPEEADRLLKGRFAVINVWRPIRGPVEDTPLALCDAESIASADLVATDLRYPDRTGEIYSLTFNPAHHWYYYPNMERDEVVFIKCYDSAHDGRARFTAHGAFDDPTAPRDAAPRESIEARTLAFFAA
jgi:hypothetical protein